MTAVNEFFILENGVQIPKLGFGTWQIPNGSPAYDAVSIALASGYRHIDTAHSYGNESAVGRAIRDSGIPRNEIFVTSKLPAHVKSQDGALYSFGRTMQEIDLDYIDLYLIHAPWPWDEEGADYRKENARVWKAMEQIYQGGCCKAVGVSNFEVPDLEALGEVWEIRPMVNQIEIHIGSVPEATLRYCHDKRILVEGYSPLATGAILGSEALARIARKYNRTVPQLCIRYVLQKGALPLVKSVHPQFIRQNADIDFEISTDDMHALDHLQATVGAGG